MISADKGKSTRLRCAILPLILGRARGERAPAAARALETRDKLDMAGVAPGD